MDLTPPPTKPPRGVKTPRETSGFLMSVIRNLSTSESNEQREREKAKLERDYKKIDQQLNELVSIHKQELTQVMQLFGKVSLSITTTRDKLHGMKETLVACKTLLSCRRDELKKLWLEGVEHKHTLKLLEEIEQLKEVPIKLSAHLNNKEYMKATKLLVSSLNIGDGALEGVEALREVKNEMHYKKEKLYRLLLKEISHIVFVEPTNELSNFVRENGSIRGKSNWCKKILDMSQKQNKSIHESSDEGHHEGELAVLVECLVSLNKLSEAAESIKSNMQAEILGVNSRVAKVTVLNTIEGVHPLLDFLDTLTEQLRKVASRFMALLISFEKSAKLHHINSVFFQPSDIWNTIQEVLQLLLTEYLDIQNTNNDTQQSSSYPEPIEDISSYFARRRIPRTRKLPLFKFEYSLHYVTHAKDQPTSNLSMSSTYSDTKEKDKVLVCSPDPMNITVIFTSLQKFIDEIEQALGSPSRAPCALNTFINDYIREVFIGKEHQRILLKIEGATKSSDAWRTPTSSQDIVDLGLVRPLLQSTVQVSNAVKELELLLESLPLHKVEVLEILIGLIKSYTETCYAAYRGMVQPEPEDKRLCSVSWLKDEDISRFLKSLPNWIDLQAQKPIQRSGCPLKREDTGEEESPEDVRQRNIKEAEILMANMAEGGIGPHEIISDPFQLKCLALLQESMDWFAGKVLQIHGRLKKTLIGNNDANLSAITQLTSTVNSLAQEFEELANTCLLMLHLEVRVQCFHYLLPRNWNSGKINGTSQDPDPRVLELSRVLVSIDEALSSGLQLRKIKYIFEGLGHLIAKIIMSSTQYMDTIDEGAIHKMCRNIFTLQQTLSNITMTRDLALDHARRYFQLFFFPPEEILNEVLEKGPVYTKTEYTNAFRLICRTYKCDTEGHNSLQRHLQRLSDILGEIGVTV